MIISQVESKNNSEEYYINVSRSHSNCGQSQNVQMNMTLLTRRGEQSLKVNEICDYCNVQEISGEPNSVGTICTCPGHDNFPICDKCKDNNKHTECAKSIHIFTYPRGDDHVFCYSCCGFPFTAAHSKNVEHV